MSPNYPDYYPPDTDCLWHITVDRRRQAVLTFSDFDLEYSDDCLDDYVDVSTLCAVNICYGNQYRLAAVIVMVVVGGNGNVCSTDTVRCY